MKTPTQLKLFVIAFALTCLTCPAQMLLQSGSLQGQVSVLQAPAPEPPLITLVQSKTNSATESSTTHALTFPATATANNLLLLYMVADDYLAGPDTPPSGWTLNANAIAKDFTGTYLMYKIAAGDETGVTVTIGSSTKCALYFEEWNAGSGRSWSLDAITNATGTGDTYGLDGLVVIPSVTSATTNALAVALGGVNGENNYFAGWTNSFTTSCTNNTPTPFLSLGSAYKLITSAGAVATAGTNNIATTHGSGVLGIFKSLPTPDIAAEDFETGETPTTPTWYGPNVIWNYTPAILGSYSLGTTNTDQNFRFSWTNVTSEIYATYAWKYHFLEGTPGALYFFKDAATAASIYFTAANQMKVYDESFSHSATTTSSMTSNTVYYVWVRYKAGTGADGIVTAAFATNSVYPTDADQIATITNGDNTNQVNRIEWNSWAVETNAFDHIGISTFSVPNGW